MTMSDAESRNAIEDTELGEYIGGYWYDKSDSPRWYRLKDITIEDDEMVFHTSSCTAESVPREVREQAYEQYSGKKLLLKGGEHN